MKKRQKGFTLIELMIVVAIISILAATATPVLINYLVRSKVSDMISMCGAHAKTIIGESSSIAGVMPGSGLGTAMTAGMEAAAIESILNTCMESKFVGGATTTITVPTNTPLALQGGTATIALRYIAITSPSLPSERALVMDVMVATAAGTRPSGDATSILTSAIKKGTNDVLSFGIVPKFDTNNTINGYENLCGYQTITYTGATLAGKTSVNRKYLPASCQ